jgi:hypothetical protein
MEGDFDALAMDVQLPSDFVRAVQIGTRTEPPAVPDVRPHLGGELSFESNEDNS